MEEIYCNISDNHKLYLHMKNFVFILFLSLIPFSAYSQKVTIQVIKAEKTSLTKWQIIDEQNNMFFSGDDCFSKDSVTFELDAGRYYFLQIAVSEIINPDSILFSLKVNGETIILVTSEIGTGIHLFPFFTGIRNRAAKITGGTDAIISDFPWQVYFISGDFLCGASIIGDNWVLTAAHCTEDDNGHAILASDMTIKVGATDLSDVFEGKDYSISEVIVHEAFNNQTYENDIALLRVNGPISYTNAVPIKLVTASDVAMGAIAPGVMSWVTGWGLTNVDHNVYPDILQKVQLPIVSNAQAETVWGPIPETDIMAGYFNGNKDACNGDSGGPLVVPVFGEYKLAGIVSWGSTNCDTYGAYTRVSDFEDWIRTKTGIVSDFRPSVPVGDNVVCQGEMTTAYSTSSVPTASDYHWELFPVQSGTISGNSETSTVIWNPNFTGSASVIIRVTIDNTLSEWSKLDVNVVNNTTILSQSVDTNICAKQPIILNVDARGYNLTYTWRKDGQNVQTGASGDLIITNSSVNNSGSYICEVSGLCGSLFSPPIKLMVLPLTKITFISPDIEVSFGTEVTLEVDAEGHNLVYLWEKDNVLIAKTDSSRVLLQNVNANDIGLYQSTVTGTCGTEVSNEVYVYVKKAINSTDPEIFVWPTITSDEFNVAFSMDDYYTIQIFTSMGQLMKEQTSCRYQTTLSVSNWSKGLYIINVFTNSIRKSIKLIKQ